SAERVYFVIHALTIGYPPEELHDLTKIDPWFLDNLSQIVERERELRHERIETISKEDLRAAKRMGFSDQRLATVLGVTEEQVRNARIAMGIRPVFKRVDT